LSVTSWRPRGNGIGSSNCRFQPVVLREAMRALLCDMGNVDQVLHLGRKSVIAKRKFALLLRLAFLEGANRAKTIFTDNPPSRAWVFSEPITLSQRRRAEGEWDYGLCLVRLGQRRAGLNRIEMD
jgi:hypothetical protein